MPKTLVWFAMENARPDQHVWASVLLEIEFALHTTTTTGTPARPVSTALGVVEDGLTAMLLGGAIVRSFVTTHRLPLTRLVVSMGRPRQVFTWSRCDGTTLDADALTFTDRREIVQDAIAG